MNALKTATGPIMRACAAEVERGFPSRGSAIQLIAPVSRRPEATMKSTPTVTIPGLASPPRNSFSVMTPSVSRIARPPERTR